MPKIIEHTSIEESFYDESYKNSTFFQGMPFEKYKEHVDERKKYLEKNKLPLLAINHEDELLGYIFISARKVGDLYLKNHDSSIIQKLKNSNLEYTLKEKSNLIDILYLTTTCSEKFELERFKPINLRMGKDVADDSVSYGIEFKELCNSEMDKYFDLDAFKKATVRDYMLEDPIMSESEAVAKFEKHVLPVFKLDNQKMYGVCWNNEVIGILWLYEEDSETMFIAYIEIFKEFRGQGFGKKVMYDMFSFVNNLGYKTLHLHVFGHNEKAVKLYEKTGFKNTLIRYRYTR
ncbi:GNAT family N-acetyltransferase [Proteinivorax hydrogeniformans]|uniref:GNAT family N-acetyltransferase n=1 Tax=Proteinivorax hydrogeniformans TaxID=1826727 RepID=A0AAU8HS72_9FIRM